MDLQFQLDNLQDDLVLWQKKIDKAIFDLSEMVLQRKDIEDSIEEIEYIMDTT